MNRIEKAREFIDEYVKTLPLPVRLNGITKAERNEAASLCADYAESAVREREIQIDGRAIRLARINDQRVGEKNDLYITLEQLHELLLIHSK